VFLHGFMGSAADWEPVIATLADAYRCVAVDLPGHGASLGLPPEAYAFAGAARRLRDTLDGLGIGRAALVGYSMGGRLALYVALRHPERCAGLLLESASPGLRGAEERAARRRSDEALARRLEAGDFERFLEDWYRQPLFASLARDQELLRRTVAARRRNDPRELARSLRGMGTGGQPSLWEELPQLAVPALAVVGELDEKFVGIARRMAGRYPALEVAVAAGAGHNARAEAPDAYLEVLERFLDWLRAGPGATSWAGSG
jgi:2-succinyl-6-hydroxy-2,4-cyclohexadiene-1-carboxylate synthase